MPIINLRHPWFLPLVACAAPTDSPSTGSGSCAATTAPPINVTKPAVGTEESTTAYTVPWTGEARDLAVHAWYPTHDTEGTPARWLGMVEDPLSLVGASFDPPDETCKLPLVVYTHGSQAWAGNSTPILAQLVQAGWVAAAPDHTGNTLTDNIDPKPVSFPLLRALDVRATIDWVENLPASDPLAGRVDTSRVFVYGHSYGGQTSWLLSGPEFDPAAIESACAASELGCTEEEQAAFADRVVEDRVVAVAPLAGSAGTDLVAAGGWSARDRPVLYMTGSADNDGTSAFESAAAYADSSPVTWVELAGGCHESFTSTTVPCDLDKTEGLTIAATYIADFATKQVLRSEDPALADVLSGATPVSDLATFAAAP